MSRKFTKIRTRKDDGVFIETSSVLYWARGQCQRKGTSCKVKRKEDHIRSHTALRVHVSKMAASAVAVEESEVVTALSHSLGISKEILANVASYNEDSASVLGRVKAVFDERASSEEKYRLDMANLRRARVNAGLRFLAVLHLLECKSFNSYWNLLSCFPNC